MVQQVDMQYVCQCGETAFEIFPGWIKCKACGAKFNYYHGFLHDPKIFNGRRESYRIKEKANNAKA
jgi:hypothetical protein